MTEKKKTWWSEWGKIAAVITITISLIGGLIAGAVRVNAVGARADRVPDILSALQDLREVLIKNGIKWDPSEFKPVRSVVMAAPPREDNTTFTELVDLVHWCQARILSQDNTIDDLKQKISELQKTQFPLQPIRPQLVP